MRNMKKDFKLSDIPRHNVYRVPEGYFDRLPMRVMECTAAQERMATTLWLARLWQPIRLTVAPLLLLFLFVGAFLFSLRQAPQQETLTVATLSDEEIVNYLSTYAQMETADLEEYLAADQSLASDFLNVSAMTAEEELQYYPLLDDLDY
ncbi:hypothetical protein [Pontibacter russatus]|uniref:hypothetical protein n=1 Tax=Pontibacter russatus TaxID=2694929 RepID=UPI00137A152A|nr:hypothetical protein [Pontibacter russatus]